MRKCWLWLMPILLAAGGLLALYLLRAPPRPSPTPSPPTTTPTATASRAPEASSNALPQSTVKTPTPRWPDYYPVGGSGDGGPALPAASHLRTLPPAEREAILREYVLACCTGNRHEPALRTLLEPPLTSEDVWGLGEIILQEDQTRQVLRTPALKGALAYLADATTTADAGTSAAIEDLFDRVYERAQRFIETGNRDDWAFQVHLWDLTQNVVVCYGGPSLQRHVLTKLEEFGRRGAWQAPRWRERLNLAINALNRRLSATPPPPSPASSSASASPR